jgi:TldD protein
MRAARKGQLPPRAIRAGRLLTSTWVRLAPLVLITCAATVLGQQRGGNAAPSPAASPAAATDGSADPMLRAMSEELNRSRTSLKMDNLPAPYYIEFHVSDVDDFTAEASFGAIRLNQRAHSRTLRVVVRVGDYKHDSYAGPGTGVASLAPLDNDPVALRRALWLAADRAYKSATQALASKQAAQNQLSADQGFDDFAHAQPLQSIGPLARLNIDTQHWADMLVNSTALFKSDPKLQSFSAQAHFRVLNQYFVNSEGTVTRQGSEVDALAISGTTQAADGMRLERTPDFVASKTADLPTPEKFQAAAAGVIEDLKALREAPLVEEDYQGPLLFAADAAADEVFTMIGPMVRANGNAAAGRGRGGPNNAPGRGGRGAAQAAGNPTSNYKTRVLPTFMSVFDDPTMSTFQGRSLVGNYDIDDEGVRAAKVSLIEKGQLVNYLLGREPMRDFPDSNGHGRAGPGQTPRASISNLVLQAVQPLSPDELKKKLIDLCRSDNKPYGYYIKTLSLQNPGLLYRVYVQDGHEELVRGAIFNEFDERSLRNDMIAAGSDPIVSNQDAAIPTTVISPSLLFSDLELRRGSDKNPTLPKYNPPDLTSSR